MRYGLPYCGSKNAIAEDIINFLPSGETFVDLFAGGGAITHCAVLSGKWKRFIMNDKAPGLTEFFMDVVNGKYANRTEWVSRESFHMLKDADWFIKLIWSFGNNGQDYIYGKDIEEPKEYAHKMITAKTIEERRLWYQKYCKCVYSTEIQRGDEILERMQAIECLESLQRLQSLQSLESLQSLQSLQRLQSLQSLQSDYSAVHIPDNAVVYCDIPYDDTDRKARYAWSEFNRQDFLDWAVKQPCIYISEYNIDDDRFVEVWHKEKQILAHAKGGEGKAIERIYIPKANLKYEPKRLDEIEVI